MPNGTSPAWEALNLSVLRFSGRHLPAAQQMHLACETRSLDIKPVEVSRLARVDTSLIDAALPLNPPAVTAAVPDPGYRPVFKLLTAQQRWVYYNWLLRHEGVVQVGYAYLYAQMLEASLFDEFALDALAEMRWLLESQTSGSIREFVAFALAVGSWMHRQPEYFRWICQSELLPSWELGSLLALQIDLDIPLSASQVSGLAHLAGHSWGAWARQHPEAVRDAVEQELAQYGDRHLRERIKALDPLRRPAVIRLLNAGLVFTLQTVDVLADASFRHALGELLRAAERAAQLGGHFVQRNVASAGGTQWVDRGWYAVLEFGETTSDKLGRVVRIARRHPGYVKLLDENREIVYRTLYRRRDLDKFWYLFDMVRGWKSTRVYINGNPINPDYVWYGSAEFY